jgi:hypothetical protein
MCTRWVSQLFRGTVLLRTSLSPRGKCHIFTIFSACKNSGLIFGRVIIKIHFGVASRSVLLNIPGLVLVQLLTTVTGLVVYAYYANAGCDPLAAKYIRNPNQVIFLLNFTLWYVVHILRALNWATDTLQMSVFVQLVPYFVTDVLNYWGFPGLFLAVLFCGSLR